MKYFASFTLFVFVTVPQMVSGSEDTPSGLVSCKEGGDCNFCDFTTMVNTINIWLLAIVSLIAVIIVIYAGFKITSSRGEVGMVTEGRKLIGNVAIGIFIVVLAITIIDVILKTATGGGYGFWNKPANCGSQGGNTGLYDGKINTKVYEGISPEKDGFVNDSGFIDAPYPSGSGAPTVVDPRSAGSNQGGINTGRWDDPTTGGSSYIDDDGFIDVVVPLNSDPPTYNYEKSGPQ